MKFILPLLFLLSVTNCEGQSGSANAPDYSQLYYWAAHPQKKDPSDTISAALKKEVRDTSVDVFFIHPTTYTRGGGTGEMNADLQDADLNADTDNRPILYQASVFNAVGRIFAPRYRQAHLRAFYQPMSVSSKDAFDMAYADVKSAFLHFISHENKGRPFIIASHSQGTMHAVRLLKELVDGKNLQRRLVCAYLVGWRIKPDEFASIPVGTRPDATGCFVGWRSFREGRTDRVVENETGQSVCVNPVTWTTGTEKSEKEDHAGALGRDVNIIFRHTVKAAVEPDKQILWVELPDVLDRAIGNMHNLHVVDYNLFWLDIRENSKLRVAAFWKK